MRFRIIPFVFLAALLGRAFGEDDPSAAQRIEALIEEIAPEKGLVRPPFQLARQDLGLKPDDDKLSELRAQACSRQDRLVGLWRRAKLAASREELGPIPQAQLRILRYAFGEAALDETLRAAQETGATERLRLARLLLAECRFDEAVAELTALAEGQGKEADAALALLVRHAEERKALGQRVTLVPLTEDLDAWLAAKAGDHDASAKLIDGLRHTVSPRLPPRNDGLRASVPIERRKRERSLWRGEWTLPDIREIDADEPELGIVKLTQAFLQTSNGDLLLTRLKDDEGLVTGDVAALSLTTRCGGAVTLRRYRLEDREAWEQGGPELLGRLAPERIWSHKCFPLDRNNHEEERTATLELDELKPGYHIVTAEARYCPALAVQTFAVSRRVLYVHAAANRTIVVVADRNTSQPLAGQEVALTAVGQPDFDALRKKYNASHDDAFRAGYEDRAHQVMNGDPGDLWPLHLETARSYAAGRRAREEHPPLKHELKARTDAFGCAVFDLDLSQADTYWNLEARGLGPDFCEAALYRDSFHAPKQEWAEAVVWAAQPVYRPGETVQLKGILRRFEFARPLDHDAKAPTRVEVEVKGAQTLWKGDCALSAAGAFHAEFPIPAAAELGEYHVEIKGTRTLPYRPFSVQEFRLPPFLVEVKVERENVAAGKPIRGEVDVRYGFGKPAAGAAVEVALGRDEGAPTATVLTDEDGKAHFEFESPLLKSDSGYRVCASVTDVSGQTCSDSCYVTVRTQPFHLSVRAGPYQTLDNSPVLVEAQAKDWDGSPLEGVAVVLEGLHQARTTNAEGKVSFRTRTRTNGKDESFSQSFRVTALHGADAVQGEASVYVYEGKFARRYRMRMDVLPEQAESLHLDRLELKVAESAKTGEALEVELEVDRAGGRKGLVLVAVGHTKGLAHRALLLEPGRHKVRFDLTDEFAPCAHVRAVLLRQGEPLERSASVYVLPKEKLATVQVAADRDEYRPGQLCQADVIVTDGLGKPVPHAEVSLGVVDEALYAVRADPTPDLQAYFFERRVAHLFAAEFDARHPSGRSLLWWKGPAYAWGYPADFLGRRRLSAAGGGSKATRGGGGRSSGGGIRTNFRTLAHWVADLVTDAEGKARVSFTFPDNVTRWRFTARAITAATLVGEVREVRRTFLPLQVELALPRALRDGDRVEAAVLVQNNADSPRTVEVARAGASGEASTKLELLAQRSGRMALPLAPEGRAPLKVSARVSDAKSGDEDAIERTWPVLPRGHVASQGFLGSVKDGGEIALDVFKNPLPDSLELCVTVEAGFAGAVASALDGLIEYPYGCVEQTMSRFMPAVIADRAFRKAGLPNPHAQKLDEVFAQGLTRLRSFQHGDGGWGWWEHDASNDYMSAYVLEGLALSRAAGRPVPERVIERAQAYLLNRLQGRRLEDSRSPAIGTVDLKSYVLHALALGYALDTAKYKEQIGTLATVLGETMPDPDASSARDWALRARASALAGLKKEAREELGEALRRFDRHGKGREHLLGVANLLEAGMALEPKRGDWIAIGRALLAARRGGGWGDTLASAACVRALSPLVEPAGASPGTLELLADGRLVASLAPEAHGSARVTLARELHGARKLTLRRKDGTSETGLWSARLSCRTATPPAPPKNPVAVVACTVAQVRPEVKDLAPGADGTLSVPRATLRVRLTCDLTQDLSTLRLSWPRPCGVEVLRGAKLENGLVAAEERDDALHFFVDRWKAGRHIVEFHIRPEASGSVFVPLPELEPMYGDPVPVKVQAASRWRILD